MKSDFCHDETTPFHKMCAICDCFFCEPSKHYNVCVEQLFKLGLEIISFIINEIISRENGGRKRCTIKEPPV